MSTIALSACTPVCQKRTSDHTIDGYGPLHWCWELNSGPLEEQTVLLTTEPSLQPLRQLILNHFRVLSKRVHILNKSYHITPLNSHLSHQSSENYITDVCHMPKTSSEKGSG